MKKKLITAMILVVLLVLTVTTPAYASGGQVRGENGQGSVNQVQHQDPPPFQP